MRIATAVHDLGHAARTLIRARAFTAVCVVSLGLGMSVVIAILLLSRMATGTPPWVREDGLVELVIHPQGQLLGQTGGAVIDTWSYPDYLDVRDAATGLTVAGWSRGEALIRLPDQGTPAPMPAMYVSSTYFSTIGVPLARGRGFTAVDDASLAEAEAILGYRLWQQRFGGDPDIVGRAITIGRTDYVIVGVAAKGYRGHVSGLNESHYSLWLPLSRHPRLAASDGDRLDRQASWVRVAGRLSPGATLAEADGTVRAAMAALAARHPENNAEKVGAVEPYVPVGARLRSQVAFARLMLLGLSSMVLLVVGLNVSGMMLVRSAMRERELAIRLAIGASRWRLIQHHLSEALVMAVFGGALASALLFGVPAVVGWAYELDGPALDIFQPDAWLVLQCVALCFITSVVLGFLPARRFSRPSVLAALKNDASGSGRRVGWLQRVTAAAQAGLAVPLLVIGGIRVDQARVALMAETGFEPRGLYLTRLDVAEAGTADAERDRYLRTVRDNVARSEGMVSVTVADGVPLDFTYRNTRVTREGDSRFITAHTTRAGAGYFDTVGVRLLSGRPIDETDRAGSERVVVLSEPLARDLFPAVDPLGQSVAFALDGQELRTYTVVGVAADVVSTQMSAPRAQLFVALAQHPAPSVRLVARAAVPEPAVRRTFESAIDDARRQVLEAASRPPSPRADTGPGLRDFTSGDDLMALNHREILTEGAVSGLGAGVALLLAALGVYGVIAFMVAMRTREIGVRMALGASRVRVLREVLGNALVLVVPGIGGGLLLAVLWVRLLDPSWYPLGGIEPLVYAMAAATALAVAALAGIPSARRAANVEPIVAMRSE